MWADSMSPTEMDNKALFTSLYAVCQQAVAELSGEPSEQYGDSAKRMIESMNLIEKHGRGLEPIVTGFTATYHHFDFDPLVPGNGYRSLVKVVRSCIFHIIYKGRYIISNCRSLFFRAPHNATEMEAYCNALCQLRALLYLAQRLLQDNNQGNLYYQEEGCLSQSFVQEYASMHKACFYGRCLGFQFSPSIRPFLQTVIIGLVSFGENYKKHKSAIVEAGGITHYGVAASSFFTSGKYVVDPELRGTEFERVIQNQDMQFWKSFWNLSETEFISGLASITSPPVRINLTLSVPPVSFMLPLASDPKLSVTISPPVAHCGPGPVHMRLISHKLLEGQNSEELMAFSRVEGTSLSLALNLKLKPNPPSPWLLVHFHGGGFVAQTSKSHENYLKSWSQELTVPILSVDYSLAPEAPFPRALEECFYAYCWALKHCHLLGTTAERVCLAGDSAGGNLCITVAMRAASQGVRVPDGIMVAYPATLLTTYASPSRLLTLIDPMLPLSVLSKCLSAYAGTEAQTSEEGKGKDSSSTAAPGNGTPRSQSTQDQVSEEHKPLHMEEYPDGFQPLRTEQLTDTKMESSPVNRNPYVSPLLAPDSMLKSLPPVHIVACALDAMLDDSVMFARRLKGLNQPVTLCVVEDLPHGFLSLLQLCKETQEASDICVAKIREVFKQGQERTDEDAGSATGGTGQETERSNGAWTRNTDGEELSSGDGQSR